VKPQDVLADHVHVRGPERPVVLVVVGAVAEGGDVVGERVDPDVGDVLLVLWQRDAPAEGAPADRQVAERPVFQAELELAEDLVVPGLGPDGVRVGLVVRDQLRQVLGEPEEVGGFLVPLERPAADGALVIARLGVVLADEGLLAGVVPAAVAAEVDVARRLELL